MGDRNKKNARAVSGKMCARASEDQAARAARDDDSTRPSLVCTDNSPIIDEVYEAILNMINEAGEDMPDAIIIDGSAEAAMRFLEVIANGRD